MSSNPTFCIYESNQHGIIHLYFLYVLNNHLHINLTQHKLHKNNHTFPYFALPFSTSFPPQCLTTRQHFPEKRNKNK